MVLKNLKKIKILFPENFQSKTFTNQKKSQKNFVFSKIWGIFLEKTFFSFRTRCIGILIVQHKQLRRPNSARNVL